jgi:hypothetical protein
VVGFLVIAAVGDGVEITVGKFVVFVTIESVGPMLVGEGGMI